mgnify:CR=1 FL=1
MIMCPMPRTILIADDDGHIRELLVFAFAKAGLETVEAADGEAALAVVAHQRVDLVVLDINMPRLDGLETCRRLRAAGDIPILFLSSRDDEIDRVLGIELSADDYVVKPFSPREVVARSMAILRRALPKLPPLPAARCIVHERLSVDAEAWHASWAGDVIPLTVTEFTILHTLAAMPSKVFSRGAIIDRLHGPGFAVTDRAIDSHIRNLRAKFAQAGKTRCGRNPPGHRLSARDLYRHPRVIGAIKRQAKNYWPALRLRTILLATLLVTAALPGVGALSLRVYKNSLVRQTEAELVAQGAALVAAARVVGGDRSLPSPDSDYRPEPSTIDLRTSPVLGERPFASAAKVRPSADAMAIARTLGPIIAATQRTTLASI